MEALRVINAYSGRLTRGVTVYPGVYALDDARLFGAAVVEIMVAKQFAERLVIDSLPEPPPAPQIVRADEPDDDWDAAEPVAMPDENDDLVDDGEADDEPYTDYESMSINDLKALMDARDIAIPEEGTGRNGSVLKRDLIAELAAADLEDEAP